MDWAIHYMMRQSILAKRNMHRGDQDSKSIWNGSLVFMKATALIQSHVVNLACN